MEAIVAFLTARLDEDEAAEWKRIDAEVANLRADGLPDTTRDDLLNMPESDHWRRPLADITAKRAIVKEYAEAEAYYRAHADAPAGELTGLGSAVRHLASLYASHKDYDPTWRVG